MVKVSSEGEWEVGSLYTIDKYIYDTMNIVLLSYKKLAKSLKK